MTLLTPAAMAIVMMTGRCPYCWSFVKGKISVHGRFPSNKWLALASTEKTKDVPISYLTYLINFDHNLARVSALAMDNLHAIYKYIYKVYNINTCEIYMGFKGMVTENLIILNTHTHTYIYIYASICQTLLGNANSECTDIQKAMKVRVVPLHLLFIDWPPPQGSITFFIMISKQRTPLDSTGFVK